MGAYYLVLGAVVAIAALLGGLSVFSRGLISKHAYGLSPSGKEVMSRKGDFVTINERSKRRMKEGIVQGRKEMRVLLFTAHPDDETMFFGPTLLALGQKYSKEDYEITLYMHCLSKGMNCGNVRLEEMKKAAPLYGVSEERLMVDDLEDGDDWSVEEVAKRLMRTVKRWKIDVVLTFDERGVSGHKNHIQCHAGALFLANDCAHNQSSIASSLLEEDESEPEDESNVIGASSSSASTKMSSLRRKNADADDESFHHASNNNNGRNNAAELHISCCSPFPRIYTLRTTPIHVKYASHLTFPIAVSTAEAGYKESKASLSSHSSSHSSSSPSSSPHPSSHSIHDQQSLLFANPNPLTVHRGMLAHASQYVWFRRLYILFSQYVFYNTLDPIAISLPS